MYVLKTITCENSPLSALIILTLSIGLPNDRYGNRPLAMKKNPLSLSVWEHGDLKILISYHCSFRPLYYIYIYINTINVIIIIDPFHANPSSRVDSFTHINTFYFFCMCFSLSLSCNVSLNFNIVCEEQEHGFSHEFPHYLLDFFHWAEKPLFFLV